MAEDIQLLRRYAGTRDEQAFAALVEHTIALVYSAALRQLKEVLSPAQIEWLGLFVEEEAASARAGQLQQRLTAEFRKRTSSN